MLQVIVQHLTLFSHLRQIHGMNHHTGKCGCCTTASKRLCCLGEGIWLFRLWHGCCMYDSIDRRTTAATRRRRRWSFVLGRSCLRKRAAALVVGFSARKQMGIWRPGFCDVSDSESVHPPIGWKRRTGHRPDEWMNLDLFLTNHHQRHVASYSFVSSR